MKILRTYCIYTKRCLLRCVSKTDIPYVFSATRFQGFNNGMLWEAPQSIKELGNLCKEVSKPGIVNLLIHLQLNLQQTVHS